MVCGVWIFDYLCPYLIVKIDSGQIRVELYNNIEGHCTQVVVTHTPPTLDIAEGSLSLLKQFYMNNFISKTVLRPVDLMAASHGQCSGVLLNLPSTECATATTMLMTGGRAGAVKIVWP